MREIKDFIDKIICGDALEVLKNIPNESIDCVVTDPPYFVLKALSEGERKKVSDTCEWDYYNDLDEFLEFTKAWLNECYRVLKQDSQCYVFWSQKWMKEFWNLKQPFEIKRMLIWYHPNVTWKFTSKMWLWQYDPIFFLTKGKVKKFNLSFVKNENKDVIIEVTPQTNYKRDKQYHPLQKPLNVVKLLIKASTNEGDIVLDPFCGSGTTLVACRMLNRKFIGIEINEKYVRIAEKRLKKIPNCLDEFIK